jgi:pimeloyl-ACP methyl ester carboxylesterase
VIAVHLQGHGKTPDIDRPLRFETLADDIAAFVAQADLGQADVLGYSLGAGVALQFTIRHPAAVDRLIVVSEPMSSSAWYPEVEAAFAAMSANADMIGGNVAKSPLGQMYPDVNFPILFRKVGELESHGFDWSADVAGIKAKTMLVFADADAMPPEHIAAFYRALGGGQRDAALDGSGRSPNRLAILPGTTHYDILSTDAVSRAVLPFLAS